MTMLMALLFVAVALTIVLFATKNDLLGYPAAIFWAIAGGASYQLSTAAWDIYYLVFFAATFGMTIFCVLAIFSLRKKDLDEPEYPDEGQQVDEGAEEAGEYEAERTSRHRAVVIRHRQHATGLREAESPRTQALHDRVARRRSGVIVKKTDYGEFK